MSVADLVQAGFDTDARNHARAILEQDFREPLAELCRALLSAEVGAVELIRGGGGEAGLTQRLRRDLTERGWRKRKIVIRKIVDDNERSSISHEIDHVRETERGAVALEIEWNNKDPFFDRDLENFQRLHAEGAVSVGVIVTRGASLQTNMRRIVHDWAEGNAVSGFDDLREFDVTPTNRQRRKVDDAQDTGRSFVDAWSHMFVGDKFGAATTHWTKLQDRLARGVGNPCPLFLVGIPANVVNR